MLHKAGAQEPRRARLNLNLKSSLALVVLHNTTSEFALTTSYPVKFIDFTGRPKMNTQDLKNFLADSPPSVVRLEIKPHFEALTYDQKWYAHYISRYVAASRDRRCLTLLSSPGAVRSLKSCRRFSLCKLVLTYYLLRASFTGTRITLRQVSPESENIFDFIVSVYKSCHGDWKSLQTQMDVNDSELTYFLEYAAQFLGNCGNYKGFGDAKFVPRAKEETFDAFAKTNEEARKYYKATKGAIFSSGHTGMMHLGYIDDGHMTTYYPSSPDITKADIDAVGGNLEKSKLLVENTRLRKTKSGSFEVLIASGITSIPVEGGDAGETTVLTIEDGPLGGKTIKLIYGDHSHEMASIAEYHKKAAKYAANDNQKQMQLAYARAFETGSMQAHKASQRFWIRDKGPMVESNIGFVETYRDPAGVRGEWEGFVAMVNLERTKAFGALVDSAASMIPKLPWSTEFEKDTFLSPDFTSLEVLSFAGSGIPAGINIPNYDDIRQVSRMHPTQDLWTL